MREALRVVGLYDGDRQVGFCRAFTDGVAIAYLADVYVLPEYRGRGLGEELVREMIENGPFAEVQWLLHTTDMHALYRKFGFDEPDYKVLERPLDEERERERVAPGQAAVRAGEELEVDAVLGRRRRRRTSWWNAVAPRSRWYSSLRPASIQIARSSRSVRRCASLAGEPHRIEARASAPRPRARARRSRGRTAARPTPSARGE